jgi:predicted cupin superfamily sugar epimerase
MPATIPMQRLIEMFSMQVMEPEGGYFAETYRSSESIARSHLPARFKGDRAFSTAIYYLLPKGVKSRLHRLAADEVWHFYLGGSLTLVILHPDGKLEKITMGPHVLKGEKVQQLVPAGCWFGAYPDPGAEYSFIGCTVAPGFEFQDFELADTRELAKRFPGAHEAIEVLA